MTEQITHPWHDLIPTSINDTYGDPFIFEQVANTAMKSADLMAHRAPIAIFTKAPDDARVLPYLKDIARNPFVVPFYSLTGLDEGGYDFDNRRRMIDKMTELFGYVVILTRPIIRNRNDDPATLSKIVKVAAEGSRLLVLGGVHDSKKRKRLEVDVEQLLLTMCDDAGVRAFHKSSCLGAYLHNQPCWVHDTRYEPLNLEVVSALGYRAALHEVDGCTTIVLPEASTGDLNFLRILTQGRVYTQKLISNYNLLTIPSGDQKYECTSSWFCWAKNIETCIDCNYCIILQIEYLKKNPVEIGTHPRDMVDVVSRANGGADFSRFRMTKLPTNDVPLHTYEDARTTKPCLRHRYSAATETTQRVPA
ncbi:hypothetical protein QLQ12_27065 [Actinoplanes sp. NEAU-A12]|uniref:Uncharacterized protein n=1 Tax=Actinoplanes sandaracinus TaxID=3045177 RepID=A0ABT6WRF8_9ACTN|nr:hypothetical protein [Actinoplanes sandaracinus]MDI6102284.1 hypothetical protein [Actinoplanes sandaracinus]